MRKAGVVLLLFVALAAGLAKALYVYEANPLSTVADLILFVSAAGAGLLLERRVGVQIWWRLAVAGIPIAIASAMAATGHLIRRSPSWRENGWLLGPIFTEVMFLLVAASPLLSLAILRRVPPRPLASAAILAMAIATWLAIVRLSANPPFAWLLSPVLAQLAMCLLLPAFQDTRRREVLALDQDGPYRGSSPIEVVSEPRPVVFALASMVLNAATPLFVAWSSTF